MGTIVFTSLSSMRAHQKHRAIHWDVVKLMVAGVILGGFVAGGTIFALISNELLAIIFVSFFYILAFSMLYKRRSVDALVLSSYLCSDVFLLVDLVDYC